MKPILKLCAFLLLIGLLFHLSCQKELSCENCKGNKPPIANAGADQIIVLPKDSVMLDGSASTDPDGTITSHKWTKISGPGSSNIVRPDSSKTLVKTLVMGIYKFELTVKDNGGLNAKDTVQIIVDDPAVNQPPIANAGADQTITLPTDSVLLDGSASFDPDGTITSFKWIKISGPGSSNIVTPDSLKTLVKTLVMGIYQFELTVKDNGGLTAKDTMQVMVDNPAVNQPPIACAGADQVITLPTNLVNLDGSCSTDPENNITGYGWTKISGPSSFNITNANAVQTQVTNLVQGVYQFELKVTDAGGLFSKDTVQITVVSPPYLNCDIANRPTSNASLTPFIQLPEPRYGVTVATAGNKIVIAGGSTGLQPADVSDRVDIYDVTTGQWTITHLSEPHGIGAVAILGNKIFFAWGLNANGWRIAFDIYDVYANAWDNVQHLSQERYGIAGGAIDNKVFFAGGVVNWAGGNFSSLVDIYDAVTNSWSTASLSQGRYCINDLEKITVTSVGHKIFFSGGSCNNVGGDCSSNRIDIYDAVTNAWSYEDYVPQNPGWSLFSGIAAGNKNYFVTGDYWQGGNHVEIRDEMTHTTTYECLSGTLYEAPFKNGNKLIFPVSTIPRFTVSYKLTQFDVYDLSTNTWAISTLPPTGVDLTSSFISVNNEVYTMDGSSIGGGFLYDKINKLAF